MYRDPVNPYRGKHLDFPGRLFPLENREADLAQIRDLIRGREVVLELCSGSGGHLIARAAESPGTLFFGFELRYKRAVRTVEKAEKGRVQNLFVLREDVFSFSEIFPESSVAGVYVNFPDPWARKKDWKHRVLCPRLLDGLCRVLVKNGFLRVKTDHREYAESFFSEVKADKRFEVIAETFDLYRSPFLDSNVQTEFEKLFLSHGLPINFIEALLVGEGRLHNS